MTFYIDTSDKRNEHLKNFLLAKGFNAIPFSDINKRTVFFNDDAFVFSPAKKFSDAELLSFPNSIKLYCGEIDEKFSPLLEKKKIKHINILKNETFAIKNAMLTAEGVLSLIIANNEKSLYENKILILGAGRVAKSCAMLFKNLGLKFKIASFNKDKFPENNYFCDKSYLGNAFVKDLSKFDVIVNTIPAKIINDKTVKKISPATLFIETASKPCLNSELATHFNYLKAPGLPQKFCANTAGKLMMENILGVNND